MTRFYEILTESNELVGSVKHYSKLGDHAKVRKLKKDNKRLWKTNKRLKKYQQKLAKYRRQIKKTYISNRSPEEKGKRIDYLTRKLNSTSRKAYEYYMSR
jgi:predicted RNase H-like nuclease (RuvC/YqgF family)